MKKFNLDKVEKVFKSCFKRKVSITLGALVVFLMTGCGGGGGGSSDNAPNYEVSGPITGETVTNPGIIPPVTTIPNENITATKNIDGTYTIKTKNGESATGIVKDGGFTITSKTIAADGSSLEGVTVRKVTARDRNDTYIFTTKDGRVTKLVVEGNGEYEVERNGKKYSLEIKNGKVVGDIDVEAVLKDGSIAEYSIVNGVVKDGEIEIEGKDGKEYKVIKIGNKFILNGKTYIFKNNKYEEVKPEVPESKPEVPGTGQENTSSGENSNIGETNKPELIPQPGEDNNENITTPDNGIEDGNQEEIQPTPEPSIPEEKPTESKPVYEKDGIKVTKNSDETYTLIEENNPNVKVTGTVSGDTFTIKSGATVLGRDLTGITIKKTEENKYSFTKDGNTTKVIVSGDTYTVTPTGKERIIITNTSGNTVDINQRINGKDYTYQVTKDGKVASNKFTYSGDKYKNLNFEKDENGYRILNNPVAENIIISNEGVVTQVKDGNTYTYKINKWDGSLSGNNKIKINDTMVITYDAGSFTVDNGSYAGTKITKTNDGYDVSGKINSNEKETDISFKLNSEGKVTGEVNVAGQNYTVAKSSSGLTGIEKDGAIYTGVSGYGIDSKEETDYGTSYIYEGKDGHKYHVLNKDTKTVVDITGIDKTINGDTKINDFTADEIVKNLYKNGQPIAKLQQTPADTAPNGNIGQYYNWNMKTPENGVTTKSVTGIDLINNEKLTITPKLGPAIGQGIIGGGAYAYNFGTIDAQSNEDIAVGQYLSEGDNTVPMMGSFNFGLINVKSNGQKTVYDQRKSAEKINGAGVYVEANGSSYATAVNYGKIIVDNTNNKNGYYSVGMLANGAKAKAFNFGTIEIKGADNIKGLTSISPTGTGKLNEPSVFMTAVNGGSIYNYGTFKSDATITLDSPISTSTRARYISDDKVAFSNDVAVMSEVGKGNEYVVENFVTAKNGVEGLDNLKSLGVYSVSTVENTDSEGNKIVDLKMTKTKKLEDLISGDLSRKVKEAGLDSYVYEDGTGSATEVINFLAENGQLDKVSKAFSEEYDNLNGAILETSRRMMDDSIELMNATESEFSGDFDRNFKGILVSKDIPNLKLGVFKNYREDANYGAGMDYNRDSITAILTQKITDKFSINYGYENTKNEYVNGSKLESHNFMLGANYVTPINFLGMNYDFTGDVVVGRNKMDKNGVKGDNFYTYSVGMLNSLNKNLELKYFNKSEVVVGLRTVVFGHESIDDKSVGSKIDKNTNLSNSFVAGLNLSKEFGITNNAKLKLTSNFGYEKELMNTSDWKDSMTVFTGNKVDMSIPMKDDKGGRAKALVKAEVEFKNGFATGVYGSVDSLGYKEVGMSISYKF